MSEEVRLDELKRETIRAYRDEARLTDIPDKDIPDHLHDERTTHEKMRRRKGIQNATDALQRIHKDETQKAKEARKNKPPKENKPDSRLKEEIQLMPLPKGSKASTWIHDFVHSKNPKFKGKSTKKRIQMALAAKYANEERIIRGGDPMERIQTPQKDVIPIDSKKKPKQTKEEVEIDEGNKENKAKKNAVISKYGKDALQALDARFPGRELLSRLANDKNAHRRVGRGHFSPYREYNEGTEIDESSDSKIFNYLIKAIPSKTRSHMDMMSSKTEADVQKHGKKMLKRTNGIVNALNHLNPDNRDKGEKYPPKPKTERKVKPSKSHWYKDLDDASNVSDVNTKKRVQREAFEFLSKIDLTEEQMDIIQEQSKMPVTPEQEARMRAREAERQKKQKEYDQTPDGQAVKRAREIKQARNAEAAKKRAAGNPNGTVLYKNQQTEETQMEDNEQEITVETILSEGPIDLIDAITTEDAEADNIFASVMGAKIDVILNNLKNEIAAGMFETQEEEVELSAEDFIAMLEEVGVELTEEQIDELMRPPKPPKKDDDGKPKPKPEKVIVHTNNVRKEDILDYLDSIGVELTEEQIDELSQKTYRNVAGDIGDRIAKKASSLGFKHDRADTKDWIGVRNAVELAGTQERRIKNTKNHPYKMPEDITDYLTTLGVELSEEQIDELTHRLYNTVIAKRIGRISSDTANSANSSETARAVPRTTLTSSSPEIAKKSHADQESRRDTHNANAKKYGDRAIRRQERFAWASDKMASAPVKKEKAKYTPVQNKDVGKVMTKPKGKNAKLETTGVIGKKKGKK